MSVVRECPYPQGRIRGHEEDDELVIVKKVIKWDGHADTTRQMYGLKIIRDD